MGSNEDKIITVTSSVKLFTVILHGNAVCQKIKHASILSSTSELETPTQAFAVNSHVIMTNLTKAKHYNDRTGIIQSEPCRLGRQKVKLFPLNDQEEEKVLNAKISNIRYDPDYIECAMKKARECVEEAKRVIEVDPQVLTRYVNLDDITNAYSDSPMFSGFRNQFA